MQYRVLTIIFLLPFVFSIPGLTGEARTWTSDDGNTIEAEFLSTTDDKVSIRRVADGRSFSISIARLSEADRQWITTQSDGPASRALTPTEVAGLTQIPDDPNGIIQLPLRVHIINNIVLEQKGVKMTTWISPQEFESVILPEINRIWKSARIEWSIESIIEQAAAEVPNREADIIYIQNAKRNAAGKSDPARMPKIHAFCDKPNGHPAINNLYFFPYLGQTSQGNASMGGNFAVVGVWSDKHLKGLRPPEKFLLAEKGPFKRGSIGRTCSHELGHNLGLGHPDQKTQTQFDLLMGGKNAAYDFTEEQIVSARKTAIERAEKVLKWVAEEGGQ